MLRKVKVEAPFYTVVSGIVGLAADQAKTRRHCLHPVKVDSAGAGEYEVRGRVQFKRGEEFGYSGEVLKNGELRDSAADKLKALQAEEDKEKLVKRAVADALDKAREEYTAKLQKAVADLRAELETKLRKEIRVELEPKIRAELAGQKK